MNALAIGRTRQEIAALPPELRGRTIHFGCVHARVASMLARCSRCTWGATPCTSRPAVPAAARRRWRMGTPEVERMVDLETTASTLARSRSSSELHPQVRCMHPARTGAASRQLVKDQCHCRRCGGGARPHGCAVGACADATPPAERKEARILSESGPLGRGDAGCAYTIPAPGLTLQSS